MTGISRNPLANRRAHTAFELRLPEGPSVTVGLGYYDDGRVGEVFMTSRKIGTAFDAECADAAVLVSIALQHGISASSLYHSMNRTPQGEPVSVIGRVLAGIIESEKDATDE